MLRDCLRGYYVTSLRNNDGRDNIDESQLHTDHAGDRLKAFTVRHKCISSLRRKMFCDEKSLNLFT
jgi:hypothetical protein